MNYVGFGGRPYGVPDWAAPFGPMAEPAYRSCVSRQMHASSCGWSCATWAPWPFRLLPWRRATWSCV